MPSKRWALFFNLCWGLGYLPQIIRGYWTGLRFLHQNVHGWYWLLVWKIGLRVSFIAVVRGRRFDIKDQDDYSKLIEYQRAIRSTEAVSAALSSLHDCLALQEETEGDFHSYRFKYHGQSVRIRFERQSQENALSILAETFAREEYGGLETLGKEVLDIGASIADTAIYFALNGAKRVIALEPYPSTFKIATHNIQMNGLTGRILLLNEGAGESSSILLDDEWVSGSTDLRPSAKGRPVRISSLEELVSRFDLDGAILKMDCEGCEYGTLLNARNDVLNRFSQIVLEYHYGSRSIVKKLKAAGFSVRSEQLYFGYNPNVANPRIMTGIILAKRVPSIIDQRKS